MTRNTQAAMSAMSGSVLVVYNVWKRCLALATTAVASKSSIRFSISGPTYSWVCPSLSSLQLSYDHIHNHKYFPIRILFPNTPLIQSDLRSSLLHIFSSHRMPHPALPFSKRSSPGTDTVQAHRIIGLPHIGLILDETMLAVPAKIAC